MGRTACKSLSACTRVHLTLPTRFIQIVEKYVSKTATNFYSLLLKFFITSKLRSYDTFVVFIEYIFALNAYCCSHKIQIFIHNFIVCLRYFSL